MSFTAKQRRALKAKLDSRAVKERQQSGQTVRYIEGWYAIAEANRLFGPEGWDRETVSVRCVWEGAQHGRASCAYIAQVRIRVRAGAIAVCRDGHGTGFASGATPGEAHELALKEAETDATKRALVTFGNPFGLCLYDKEQRQIRAPRRRKKRVAWLLHSPKGAVVESFADPTQWCSAVRRALEGCSSAAEASAFWNQHGSLMTALAAVPELTTERGDHFADLLKALFSKRLQELQQPRTAAVVPWPRRVRDKAHLRSVAQQPCLVCGRTPAQAHHLKFIEPRGLGLKPSDDLAVPLCRIHHRALHDQGDEPSWWQQHKIEPLPEAERLWQTSRAPAGATDEVGPETVLSPRESELRIEEFLKPQSDGAG